MQILMGEKTRKKESMLVNLIKRSTYEIEPPLNVPRLSSFSVHGRNEPKIATNKCFGGKSRH